MSKAGPRVVLHIDRLVLKGVNAADRDAVVDALHSSLRETLAHSFAQPDALHGLSTSSDRASLRVPPLAVGAGAGSWALGRAAAEGIVGGLKR